MESEESKVRVFPSGATRSSNDNKPWIHLIQGYTRFRVGYRFHLGKEHDDAEGNPNFLKGIPTKSALESMDRHLAQYMMGDRSEDHLAGIIFNVQLAMLNEEREGIEADYYFKLKLDCKVEK